APTPGVAYQRDSDGDGLPDSWEIANGLNPNDPTGVNGANGDPDNDGFTNLQEYLAGTDPHNAQSYLRLQIVSIGPVRLQFIAQANRSYTIEYAPSPAGPWNRLIDFGAVNSTQTQHVTDASVNAMRYYRIRTQ